MDNAVAVNPPSSTFSSADADHNAEQAASDLPNHIHMTNEGENERRAKWSEIHKAHLVKLLVEYNIPAYRYQKGWTKEAWNRIMRDMNKFSNTNYTMIQVKALEQELKKTYKLLKGFIELSGCRWDYEKHIISSPDDAWALLRERNKKARRWHNKPFPYFVVLQEIYTGRCVEKRCSRDVVDNKEIANAPMHTPSPNIPVSNNPIQPLLAPKAEDDECILMEAPCTQPPISQPQSSSNQRHQELGDHDNERRKRERKRKNSHEIFVDKFITMRELETDQYINAMKGVKERVEEKYSIRECIVTFNTMRNRFTDSDMVKATKLFMKDESYRVVFLCLEEDQRVPWLQAMLSSVEL